MKNNSVWEDVYSQNNFEISCRMIENLLKNKDLLYAYCPLVRILERDKIRVKKAVELGAGTGQMSLILKKLGLIEEAYLVDLEKNALNIAKRLFKRFGEKCTTIHSDMFKLNYKKDSFDLCFSGGLIEHFKGKEQDKAIQIHANLAKKIIFQFPANTPTYWTMRGFITLKNGSWPFGYERPLSRSKGKELMRRNNLKVLGGDSHYILPAIFCRAKKTYSKIFYSPRYIPFFKMDYALYCIKN